MEYKKLTLTADEMRELGYKTIDMIVDHFETVSQKSASAKRSPEELRKLIDGPLPYKPENAKDLLEFSEKVIFANNMHLDHPRFFAFVSSPNNYISLLADLMITGYNVFAGTWLEGSSAAQVELTTIKWLCSIFQLPEGTAGGSFVSGGSAANLTAIIVAKAIKQDTGKQNIIYFSDQTHSSIEKAIRIFQDSRLEFRKIESDSNYRLPIEELKEQIRKDKQNGHLPIAVIANAGTTNTGAIDPLNEVARLCEEENLWFHIDGAYGAVGILSEQHKNLYKGIEKADSITLDPHKWLFQPYESSCILVKNKKNLKNTFHILPEYLKDTALSEEEINFSDYGIQLTRGFKAFKIWLSFKTFGLEAFQSAIEKGMELAVYSEKCVREKKDWEIVSPANIGIVNFRYNPPCKTEEDKNNMNAALIRKIVDSGYAMISSTVLKGKTVIRLCTINPRTEIEDIKNTIDWLAKAATETYANNKNRNN